MKIILILLALTCTLILSKPWKNDNLFSRLDDRWSNDIVKDTQKPMSYKPDIITMFDNSGSLLTLAATALNYYEVKLNDEEITPKNLNNYFNNFDPFKDHFFLNVTAEYESHDRPIDWESIEKYSKSDNSIILFESKTFLCGDASNPTPCSVLGLIYEVGVKRNYIKYITDTGVFGIEATLDFVKNIVAETFVKTELKFLE